MQDEQLAKGPCCQRTHKYHANAFNPVQKTSQMPSNYYSLLYFIFRSKNVAATGISNLHSFLPVEAHAQTHINLLEVWLETYSSNQTIPSVLLLQALE